MRRKYTWILAVIMCATMFMALSGCGRKDAGSVVNDLNHVMKGLDSYKGIGTMEINSGQGDPQQYQVEVWYQAPKYYRIALTNEKKDISQIILKNDEGVFVLTPHLNKSFRFQSDWPANQGQVYVYQSLVQSIVNDQDRKFTQDNNAYVFDVAGNYQSTTLVRQKIWLSSKDYSPEKVEVTDSNNNNIVTMTFNEFQFGVKFDGDSFDMEHNMNASLHTVPTTAVPELNDVADQNNGMSDQAGSKANGGKMTGSASKDGTPADHSDSGASSKSGGGTTSGTSAQPQGSASPSSTQTGMQSGNAAQTGTGTGMQSGNAAQSGSQMGTQSGTLPQSSAQSSNAAGNGDSAAMTQSNGGTAAPASGMGTTGAQHGATSGSAVQSGTAAQSGAQSGTAAQTGSQTGTASGNAAQSGTKTGTQPESFGIYEPVYLPEGMTGGPAINDFTMGGNEAIMLRYNGKYNYTLVEAKPQDRTVWADQGEIMQVGSTLGILLGTDQHTLVWDHDGVEFRLSSGDLPLGEMLKVAASVEGQVGK